MRIDARLLSALAAVSALAACATATDKPTPPEPAGQPPLAAEAPDRAGCPVVTFANFTPERRAAADAALAETCRIIHSEAFRAEVRRKTDWFSGCHGWPVAQGRSTTAEAALSVYPSRILDFELKVGKTGGAAITDLAARSVTVIPSRFDDWISGVPTKQRALVTTLAHEMTHMIPKAGTRYTYEFSDRGNNALRCPKARLVSYGVGRIVGDLWLAEQPAT
jgi:hypothetical protein